MPPSILLAPGSADWTYDFTARALVANLSDRFSFEIAYSPADVHARAQRADLILDFWWRGHLEQHYGPRVVKQVSSHRWSRHKYGSMPPALLAHKYLARAAGVVVPSSRLLGIVGDGLSAIGSHVPVSRAPKGFDPSLFSYAERSGPLAIGWAGTGRQVDKRLEVIREACPELREAGPFTRGVEYPYELMHHFYRSLDVITCASDAEGDPRPLIEGMACGCFPVVVDVGIVPELVENGVNGLIVERSAEAFRDAFAWCARNLDYVRARGRENAEQMLATRTWAQCAQSWGAAFDRALAAKEEPWTSAI